MFVASFAEAWIEMIMITNNPIKVVSPPSRRRGLKLAPVLFSVIPFDVASFAEAWIEINCVRYCRCSLKGRLLRGGVD